MARYDVTLTSSAEKELKKLSGQWIARIVPRLENLVFGLRLSEYHTGYRAFRRQVLESVNFQMNSDRFIFDQEIIAQIVNLGLRVAEVPVPTRYFAQASSASLWQSSLYGCSILWLLVRYTLHRKGIIRQRQFDSLDRRYGPAAAPGESERAKINLQ